MTDRTDRELVERARAGDASAIGALFTRYWRAARAAAFGVTGDVASAEDAAAEAFQEAVGRLDSLRDADRFGSWLRTIVVRKAQRERPRLPAAKDLPADLSDRAERPDQAAADLRFSPYDEPRYRSALQMHEANGSAPLASGGTCASSSNRGPK